MCIKEEPDPQKRQSQITKMESLGNSTFQDLVIRCTETDPWARPNMASVIEELEMHQIEATGSFQRGRTAWGDP